MDAHPEIVCKGEAHFGSDVIDGLARLFSDYNKEIETKGGAVAHLKKFGGHTDVLSYSAKDVDFLATAAISLMLSKWLEGSETKCLGEKTPDNLAYMERLAGYFPQSRFVHIIRDGRDVAVSLWYFNMKNDIGRTIQTWGTFKKFASEFASNWNDRVSRGRAVGAGLGSERYCEIRYEDLISKPLETLETVSGFLKVDSSRDLLQSCVNACAFEKLSGGRAQGDEDHDSFYRKGVSGDWKNHFDAEDNDRFFDQCGALMEELGYAA